MLTNQIIGVLPKSNSQLGASREVYELDSRIYKTVPISGVSLDGPAMLFKRLFNRMTLTQQWVVATVLAITPLILAIGYAVWALTVQATEQRDLLVAINKLNAIDAAVNRQVKGLERAARQYYLIGEPRFYEIYRERLTSLRGYENELIRDLPVETQPLALSVVVDRIDSVGTQLHHNLHTMSESYFDAEWRTINRRREVFSADIEQATETAIADSEQRFETVVQRLVLLGSFAIPGTVLLISLSTITVVRPLWRLAKAIHRLGHHRWDTPVEIGGPADFVALGDSLEWMREQLLISDRQKEAFTRHITHELKSPLAAIVQAESLLWDEVPGSLNDQQRNVLTILRQNAQNLHNLIQQLLNYNAIRHSLIPERSCVDMQALCARICEQLMASPANQGVEWDCAGSVQYIESDYTCLEMILSNLLSNACNALAGSGSIRVTWAAKSTSWELIVEDSGPGIHPDEQAQIFKPFYQGKKKRQGPLKGSGIGLSIVRECAVTLGGSVEVNSTPGSTRFLVTLPREKHDN